MIEKGETNWDAIWRNYQYQPSWNAGNSATAGREAAAVINYWCRVALTNTTHAFSKKTHGHPLEQYRDCRNTDEQACQHSFAPLRPEKFSKFSSPILLFFRNFSRQNIKFWQFSLQISLKLNQILSEFHRLHRKRCKMPKIERKSQKIRKRMKKNFKKVRFELDKS